MRFRHLFITPYLPIPDFYTKSNKAIAKKKAAVISGLAPDMKTGEAHVYPHTPNILQLPIFAVLLGVWVGFLFVITETGLKLKKKRKVFLSSAFSYKESSNR